MTFLKLFLICMFKNPNLAEKISKFNKEKKVELCGVQGVCFFHVWLWDEKSFTKDMVIPPAVY